MKKDKIIYWTATGIMSSVTLFSVINFTFIDRYPFPEGAFVHLRLPNYFKIELTVAKILGLSALLIPNIPARIKEFAYFGFAITLVSAGIAHSSAGDAFFPFIIDPLAFLCILIVSYLYYHKIEKANTRQHQKYTLQETELNRKEKVRSDVQQKLHAGR